MQSVFPQWPRPLSFRNFIRLAALADLFAAWLAGKAKLPEPQTQLIPTNKTNG